MLEVPIKATLKEAVKKDSSGTYIYIEIPITDKVTKKVFLDPAELELIQLVYKTQK